MRLRPSLCLAALIIACDAAASSALECDRACLRGLLSQSLDAFVAHQPNAAFAATFKAKVP